MLQELLLSLSGHSSPLLSLPSSFSTSPAGTSQKTSSIGLHADLQAQYSAFSAAELALLSSLANDLGARHTSIRTTANAILSFSSSSPSPSPTSASSICKAVAANILHVQLARFQQTLVRIERGILEEDAEWVGARGQVSLSALVAALEGEGWSRKMKFLERSVQLLKNGLEGGTGAKSRGAEVVDWLRMEVKTGWPDVRALCTELLIVAEAAWVRGLAGWVCFGRISEKEVEVDSMVSLQDNGEAEVNWSAVPTFVSRIAAEDALFIGRSLRRVRNRQGIGTVTAGNGTLVRDHLRILSELKSPVTANAFTAAIAEMRRNLSRDVLRKLLPVAKVVDVLELLRKYFLLERGEFAVALIMAAEERLDSRNQWNRSGIRGAEKRPPASLEDGLAGLTINEGEVHAVLAKAWAALASLSRGSNTDDDDDEIEEESDRARAVIRLGIKNLDGKDHDGNHRTNGHHGEHGPAFDDLLLPSPTTLTLNIPSPLDLFLTPEDVHTYSRIHAYLLATRRAPWRLSKLFLLTRLRRPSRQTTTTTLTQDKRLRPIWAAVSTTTAFFTELGSYLQGEVISESWKAFERFLAPELSSSFQSSRPTTSSSSSSGPHPPATASSSQGTTTTITTALGPPNEWTTAEPRDPETLARAHRNYLHALEHSLLLSAPFTRPLRSLMASVDHVVGLLQRLDVIVVIAAAGAAPLPPTAPLTAPSTAPATTPIPSAELEAETLIRQLGDGARRMTQSVRECVAVLAGMASGSASAETTGWSAEEGAGAIVGTANPEAAGGIGRGFRAWRPGRRGVERLVGKLTGI